MISQSYQKAKSVIWLMIFPLLLYCFPVFSFYKSYNVFCITCRCIATFWCGIFKLLKSAKKIFLFVKNTSVFTTFHGEVQISWLLKGRENQNKLPPPDGQEQFWASRARPPPSSLWQWLGPGDPGYHSPVMLNLPVGTQHSHTGTLTVAMADQRELSSLKRSFR